MSSIGCSQIFFFTGGYSKSSHPPEATWSYTRVGKPEIDHIYPSELGQFEEGMGIVFIQLGVKIVSMSQIMVI